MSGCATAWRGKLRSGKVCCGIGGVRPGAVWKVVARLGKLKLGVMGFTLARLGAVG
jgi:hypothetical protein